MPTPSPLLIAIDGRSGAGKTALTVELAALLREHHTVSVFHLEDIYPGWDGLQDGILRYVEGVLAPLGSGSPARWNAWDWVRNRDGDERSTPAADIVLLEGVGAAAAAAREHVHAVIWVEADAATRHRTAIGRDGDSYAPFWQRWADQEDAWLDGDDPAGAADVVVQGHRGPPSPLAVRRALAALPACAPLLAPERAERRGLTVTCERIDAAPDAAALFSTLYGSAAASVWLDSSDAGPAAGPRSRFSIMADDGGAFGQRAQHRLGLTETSTGDGRVTTRVRGPFFRWLDDAWGRRAVRSPEGLECGFTLGWLGYLAYELKRETGGSDHAGTGDDLPDAALIFAGRAVVIDHTERAVFLLTLDDGRPDREREEWADRARQAVRAPSEPPTSPPLPVPRFRGRDTRAGYLTKVRQAQAEIADGTTYEACLTTSLCAHVARMDPLATYLRLRSTSPAPFAHLLRFPGFAVASTSPERFLAVTADGTLRAEPIKGTRGRSADPAADHVLLEDLRTSAKDRAENIMIVDLLRNDLSHHAVPGSVQVTRLCDIETYATVHQMVSTIEARLRPGSARAGVVAAAFPAGSMTGAPKISTMRILDELEQAPRGPYSGAAGYFSLDGAADLAVVIRTLVLEEYDGGTRLTLGIGGAVTSDSDPAEEWEEVRTKAHGVLTALGAEFPADHIRTDSLEERRAGPRPPLPQDERE